MFEEQWRGSNRFGKLWCSVLVNQLFEKLSWFLLCYRDGTKWHWTQRTESLIVIPLIFPFVPATFVGFSSVSFFSFTTLAIIYFINVFLWMLCFSLSHPLHIWSGVCLLQRISTFSIMMMMISLGTFSCSSSIERCCCWFLLFFRGDMLLVLFDRCVRCSVSRIVEQFTLSKH